MANKVQDKGAHNEMRARLLSVWMKQTGVEAHSRAALRSSWTKERRFPLTYPPAKETGISALTWRLVQVRSRTRAPR